MIIKSLTIKNYRNYTDESIEFNDGINIISGKNASGKTNLIEAIYLLGVGKSPRTSKDKELIKFDEKRAYIKAVIQKKYRSHTIEFMLDGNLKKISIDGLPIHKLSELIGILNVVYFSPDELKFIKETPAERRRFMDISLSQQNKIYFNSLIKYNKILAQRNKLLKTENQNVKLKEMLSIWDVQLAEFGTNLILARRSYIKKLNFFAIDIHNDLTANKEKIELIYESIIESDTRNEILAEFTKKLTDSIDKDINLFYTTVGPHRDDIKILINNTDIRKYGSQGQQRTAALSIKIAELTLFKQETGETPVLLLDDVLSELDLSRRLKLYEQAKHSQTLITCTDFDFKPSINTKLINIADGKIIKSYIIDK